LGVDARGGFLDELAPFCPVLHHWRMEVSRQTGWSTSRWEKVGAPSKLHAERAARDNYEQM
jgi:hypothetical protein